LQERGYDRARWKMMEAEIDEARFPPKLREIGANSKI
jgi:hypothetical protein